MNFIRCLTCCQHHELPSPSPPFLLALLRPSLAVHSPAPPPPLPLCLVHSSSLPAKAPLSLIVFALGFRFRVLLLLLLLAATSCRNSCCCFAYFLVIVWLVYAVGVPRPLLHNSEGERASKSQVSDTQFKFMPVYNHCLPVIKP